MAALLCGPARLALRLVRGLLRLLDGDQTQGERRAALGFDPNRTIDQPSFRGLGKFSNEIERMAFAIEPARALPTSPNDEVSFGLDQPSHALRLQIGPIGKANLARNRRYPIERLAFLLIGQLEVAKTFPRNIERAVNAPQLILLPPIPPFLRHRGRIDDPDQPTPAPLRRAGRKR